MFYVDRVIKLSVFLELLWKYSLILRYKLNRFRPQRIEPVGYLCTFIWRLRRVHNVRQMVLYG